MSSGKSRRQSPKSSIPDFSPEDFIIPELPDDEDFDKADYEGRLKKIELETKQGLLLDKDENSRQTFSLGRLLRDKLSGLPSKLAAEYPLKAMLKRMRG